MGVLGVTLSPRQTVIAALEDEGVARFSHVGHDHGGRNFAVQLIKSAVKGGDVLLLLFLERVGNVRDEIIAKPFFLKITPAVDRNVDDLFEWTEDGEFGDFV